jgi:phage-related protein
VVELGLIQANPWVSLYTIDVPTSPATKMRLTAYPAADPATGIALYFERDSNGAAVTYYSFSIGHEETRADSEGGIQKVRVQLQNLTRESVAIAETYNGLIGQKIRHVIVRRDELPDATPAFEEVMEILEANFTEQTAEFVCGRTALAQRKLGRKISRTHCQHRYGGPGCGYDTTRAGALQTCDFTLDGPVGCTAHGIDEAAAGRTNRHPKRILLFPGVARSSGISTT